MHEHRSKPMRNIIRDNCPMPWRVPVAVEDVAETGERFDLVADADTRAAVARVAGLRDLPRLQANFRGHAARRRLARRRPGFRDRRSGLRGHARTARQ